MRLWFHRWLGFHLDDGAWVGIGGVHRLTTLNLGFVTIQRRSFMPFTDGE